MNNATGDDRFTHAITSPERDSLPADLALIYRRWLDLCGERLMPTWQEWTWAGLPKDIVSWCAVVNVNQYPLDFTYRFSGEERTKILGNDYMGKSVLDMTPAVMSNKILKEYATVVERRAPLLVNTFGFGQPHNQAYRLLRVPFGSGDQVDQILSACTFEDTDASSIYALFGTDKSGGK